MPAQTVLMLRLSLFYLALAVTIGGILLFHKVQPLHPGIWALLPIHFETAIWGWFIQFVIGTAYWMFPRFLKDDARGSVPLAWCMTVFFNTGLLILIAGYFTDGELLNLKLIGRGFIGGSILLFAGLIWNRVVSYRNLNQ